MKLLTVFVSISVYCANGYTIFPLPGQSAAANPKFGRLDSRPLSSGQTVTAKRTVPFFSTFPPLPSVPSTSYKTSRVPQEPNSPSPAPLKRLLVSSYPSKAPEVLILRKPSTLSSYASTSEEPKTSSLVQNMQSPSQKNSGPEAKPGLLNPIKPDIEAPSKDLLPPKLS